MMIKDFNSKCKACLLIWMAGGKKPKPLLTCAHLFLMMWTVKASTVGEKHLKSRSTFELFESFQSVIICYWMVSVLKSVLLLSFF